MSDETDWLRRYARDRSQEAFRALADRYVDLVYASARRQVGDADLARDVTQAVFLVLAEKSDELARARARAKGGDDRPLASWLLKVTRYASSNAVRARARRAVHEQRAAAAMADSNSSGDREWEELSPLLDEGMTRLRAAERDVLVLRFFDRKTAREVGEALNISEDAAEKRIARAVEKLRDFFRRSGVAVSASALATTLATHAAAEAAPVGLNASIATMPSASTASAIAKGTVIAMATAKTKSLAVLAICLFLLGGGAVAVTSAIRSAKPRQLTVAPAHGGATRPTSLPALIVTSPAPPPAVATFANGTTYELLGITDAPGRADRWWAADGTPIAAPSPLPSPGSAPGRGEFVYQVILRKTDPPPPPGKEYNDFTWGVSLLGPEMAWMGIADTEHADFTKGASHRLNFIFAMKNQTATGSVSMKLGHAPWIEDVRITLPPGGAITQRLPSPTSAPATQPTVIVERITDDRDGKAEVWVRFSPDHDRASGYLDTQALLIDAGGKPHFYGGQRHPRNFKGGVVFIGFDISAKQAVAFQYRYRPWERHELSNVSLRPGEKTTVTSVARPIRLPTSGPATP